MTDDEVVAGGRDASRYDRPNVRTPKAVHVADPDGFAVCRPECLLVDLRPARLIPDVARCRRRACATRFAAASRSPEGGATDGDA